MSTVDIETKKYIADSARFADAFNFFIYDGRQVIRPEELREMDTAELGEPYGNDAKEPIQRFRDSLKLYTAMRDDRAVYMILGIEAQSAVHYAMPVRAMLYDALNYARQVTNTAAHHKREKTKLTHEEFFVRLPKRRPTDAGHHPRDKPQR